MFMPSMHREYEAAGAVLVDTHAQVFEAANLIVKVKVESPPPLPALHDCCMEHKMV